MKQTENRRNFTDELPETAAGKMYFPPDCTADSGARSSTWQFLAYLHIFLKNFAASCVKNTCRSIARQVFLPCLQQNYARKSTYISCEDKF